MKTKTITKLGVASMAVAMFSTASTAHGATTLQTIFTSATATYQTNDFLQVNAGSIAFTTSGDGQNSSDRLRDATSATGAVEGYGTGPDGADSTNWDFTFGSGDLGLGHTITDITLHSGLPGSSGGENRGNLEFAILYSTVATPEVFQELLANDTYINAFEEGVSDGFQVGEGVRVTVSLAAAEVTNLNTLRFVIADSPTNGNQSSFYSEIDVNGFSTTPIPEPSSTALIGLGGLALILRRRR